MYNKPILFIRVIFPALHLSPAVFTCSRCMRPISQQVPPSWKLHWNPESCWQPRPDQPEDRSSGLHCVQFLAGGAAERLPGAASRLAGERPAEGRPWHELWGVCVWGSDQLGEGPARWALPSAGQVTVARATAAAGAGLLCGKSGGRWIDSQLRWGFSLVTRGPSLPPHRDGGQYAQRFSPMPSWCQNCGIIIISTILFTVCVILC